MERLTAPSGYKGPQPTVKPDLVGKLSRCGHIYHIYCLVAMYNNGNKVRVSGRDEGVQSWFVPGCPCSPTDGLGHMTGSPGVLHTLLTAMTKYWQRLHNLRQFVMVRKAGWWEEFEGAGMSFCVVYIFAVFRIN